MKKNYIVRFFEWPKRPFFLDRCPTSVCDWILLAEIKQGYKFLINKHIFWKKEEKNT